MMKGESGYEADGTLRIAFSYYRPGSVKPEDGRRLYGSRGDGWYGA
jgi:hypothetical protein